MFAVSGSLLLAATMTATVVRWTVWVGLVLVTVALAVLMRTAWGQSNPLRKCIVLSLIAHLLLVIYLTTISIVSGHGPGFGSGPVTVAIIGGTEDTDGGSTSDERPWDQFVAAPGSPPAPADATLPVAEPLEDTKVPERQTPAEVPAAPVPPAPPEVDPPSPGVAAPPVNVTAKPVPVAVPVEIPAPSRVAGEPTPVPEPAVAETDDPDTKLVSVPRETPAAPSEKLLPPTTDVSAAGTPLSDAATATVDNSSARVRPVKIPTPMPSTTATDKNAGAATASTTGGMGGQGGDATGQGNTGVPSPYRNRLSTNRGQAAASGGGNADTEAAVAAALQWLSANQSPDGRWDPRRYGAGREVAIDGQARGGAGTQADTGITGLALLAYLGAGHSHKQGEHRESVRRGIDFLLRSQSADGHLGGYGTLYEKMYCHAMATFALAEACAMTHDPRLLPPLRRAIDFSIHAQHSEGGWRYQAGEPGDMSQLGWQLMALRSASLAGVAVPDRTRDGMVRFIKSVSSGKHGGLASYRLGTRATRTMTAEALVCRQLLGMTHTNPAGVEAAEFLLQEPPGVGQTNVYYWYYATLGLFQLQGTHWEHWNTALLDSLVKTQRTGGELAGSWDPDETWGNYGGRIYNTALSAMCLEVYYRYAPLEVDAASRQQAPH